MRTTKKPHIEITGFKARFYDLFVFFGTLGLYQGILQDVIKKMKINHSDRILDLGAGTGNNDRMMRKYLSDEGHIYALEISKEMQRKFEKKCRKFRNVSLVNLRIENTLPYSMECDKVFMSFIIHGFAQDKRLKIIQNAYNALKPGGKLLIFDWNEFDLQPSGIMIRLFMHFIECPEARDFIKRDFRRVLKDSGFKNLKEDLYARNKIRLITAHGV